MFGNETFMNKAARRVAACAAYTGRLTKRSGTLITCMAVPAIPVFAQSGDISGATGHFTTLGATILRLVVALAGFAFVGLIIWGGLTLATNRPKGLAMIGGGMVGALLSGLAFVLVQTLTGESVSSYNAFLYVSALARLS